MRELSIISKNVNLNINCPNDILIFSDVTLIRTLLYIFIENAIKFSPENGNIFINVSLENERILITIQDEGCGFSQNALDNLFQVFFTDKRNENNFGIGIGLATAREIVDLLSGNIIIKNNNGARIELSLPINYDLLCFNK